MPSSSVAYNSRLCTVLSVIGVLYSFTPLSWAYVTWTVLSPASSSPLHRLTFAYAIVEVLFSILYRGLAWRVNRQKVSTNYSPRELRDVVKRVLESNIDEPQLADESDRNQEGWRLYDRRSSLASDSDSNTTRRSSWSSIDSFGDSESSVSDGGSCSDSERTPSPSPRSYNFLSPPLAFDDPRAKDFRETSRNWFHGAPFSSVTLHEASQWMSWSLYGQPYEAIVAERDPNMTDIGIPLGGIGRDKKETVDLSVRLWEARAGVKLPTTAPHEAKTDVVRLTLDYVKVMSRPFLFYALVWVAQNYYRRKLLSSGFEEQTHGGLRYFVRIPKGWKGSSDLREETRPNLLLHGLGIGPIMYSAVIKELSTGKDFTKRPLAILVQPHLSMSFFDSSYLSPPDADANVESITAMAKACKFDKSGITVLSHSNGTVVHSWLLKGAPWLVARSCMVDPVCFALWEPSLPYHFLYAAVKSPMQYLMRYFVSRELGVANLLHRNFDWISNICWPSDIPDYERADKATVFLSERDAIVDTPRIFNYLAREGMREGGGLRVFPKKKHGESMMKDGQSFRQVMDWVANK